MNRFALAWAGVRRGFSRHVGLLLGATTSTAVLVGALAVGDSVDASLRRIAEDRIGRIDAVLDANDRFVRNDLAAAIAGDGGSASAAPVLRLRGIATTPDAARRANDVTVLGVDERFFALAPGGVVVPLPADGTVLVNARLGRQLDVHEGDTLVLRASKPSGLASEAALADEEDASVALRVRVAAILDVDSFGRFNLSAEVTPPFLAVVSSSWLGREIERVGRANLVLVGNGGDAAETTLRANARLRAAITLADLELVLDARPDHVELKTPRVFLDLPIEEAVRSRRFPALGGLTYFVNELRLGDRATPYSTVTALGPLTDAPLAGTPLDAGALIPPSDEDIVINEWLARDLAAAPGDAIELRYFALTPSLKLEERSRHFRVHAVVPIDGLAADPSWMPEYPGLEDSDDCRDWEPGIPIDLERIRDVDEEYWDLHRGTPKAFLTLAAGQEIWGSRFGRLTSIRTTNDHAADLEAAVTHDLDPRALGLFLEDRRTPALASGRATTDFGGLFLGLSLFLIVAAVLLTTLLFVFGVEQRSAEIGTLLAIGYRPGQVRNHLLLEAGLVSLLGTVCGVFLGIVYTRLILRGLESQWSDAVASTSLVFAAEPTSLLAGAALAFVTSMAALTWAVRSHVRRPPVELFGQRGASGFSASPGPAIRSWIVLAVALGGAVTIAVTIDPDGGPAVAGAWFGVGTLTLISALAASRLLLRHLARASVAGRLSLLELGLRNSARRPGRSLATISLLASGTFLVVAIGVNRLGPPRDVTRRASGTGGFSLFGSSTLPVLHDLGTEAGRAAYGLTADELRGVTIVPMRVRDGDEASCLNLGTSHDPRLYGVDPDALARRGSFRFKSAIRASESPWTLLDGTDGEAAVPAIGDDASVTWALHKKVGDVIEYVDDGGRPFLVRIAATVEGSILQGMLLISDDAFRARFPAESGFRAFLVDAPAGADGALPPAATVLTSAMADVGLELESTAARLAAFNAVQNTYLAIFQVLGGLGLFLGTAGLAMVVLRNVLERRAELAVCRAVGYSTATIRSLVLGEHGLLLLLGLLAGIVAALAAALPGGRGGLATTPLLLVLLSAASGITWVVAATSLAVRGGIVNALRSE